MVTYLQIPRQIISDSNIQLSDYYLNVQYIQEVRAISNAAVVALPIRTNTDIDLLTITLLSDDISRTFHALIAQAIVDAESAKTNGAFYALPLDLFYNDNNGVRFRALAVNGSTFNGGTAITSQTYNGTTDTLSFTTSSVHSLRVGDRVQCTFGDLSNAALVALSGFYNVNTVPSTTQFTIIPRAATGASSGTVSATTVLLNANNLITTLTWS